MNLIYAHRRDYRNPGDLWSTPREYVSSDYEGIVVDNMGHQGKPNESVDAVIFGGGALLSGGKWFDRWDLIKARYSAKKYVAWGVGTRPNINNDFPEIVGSFDLYSTRDWDSSGPNDFWTPCVSCLHPLLKENQDKKPTKDILIVDHFKREIETDVEADTRIVNKPSKLEDMIACISDHRYIITASYHVMYWATLLKRKVVVGGKPRPWKFEAFKYAAPQVNFVSKSTLDQPMIYDFSYAECVQKSMEFGRKVALALELPDENILKEFGV